MRPTLRQLQYLVAIAETGRFGEAATRLNVSQPGLSAQMTTMEEELGVIVFERAPSGAILTPRGHEILKRARLVLRDVEDLKAVARHDESSLIGQYKLGVLPIVGPYLLPMAVRHLHAGFPDLRFTVREATTLDLEVNLHAGLFDTIISSAQDHAGVEHNRLFEESLWICIAADDPLALHKTPISLAELKGRRLLTLNEDYRLHRTVSQIADAAGAEISREYEGTSLDSLRLMAEMGAGVAVIPSLYALSEARRDPHLNIRRIDHALATHPISLIWRRNSPLAPSLLKLAEALRRVAVDLLKPA